MHIIDFKNTCLDFQKPSQTPAVLGAAKLSILAATFQDIAKLHVLGYKTTLSDFHYLSSVFSKQLCALANLGCTCEAGTS